MGSISRETFKKLTLVYLIGQFNKDGAYSSYRVQKVLYFGLKDSDRHPFLFQHTRNGQYSREARQYLDSLVSIGVLEMTGLPQKEDSGARWKLSPSAKNVKLCEKFYAIAPKLAISLDESIQKYGYLKTNEIMDIAHQDELLQHTPFGQILFVENLPSSIQVELDDEECEELELLLSGKFITCTNHILAAIDSTDFNIMEVEVVESFL